MKTLFIMSGRCRNAMARHRSRVGGSVCRPRVSALLAALLLCVGGCQSYERKPLDPVRTRAAWLSRSPADQSVREFAAALARTESAGDQERIQYFDPSDGLTRAEAEVVALVYNPALRQARLEADVTRADAVHAGLWQDPVVGVDLERVVSGTGAENPWVLGSALGITIPLSGMLEAERAHANAEVAAELVRLAAKEWATRSALREVWIEWSAARMRAEVADELITRLRDVTLLADSQEQAGSLTRVEARLFRVELAGREADQIATRATVKELELRLRAMMGLAPDATVVLVPAIAFEARSTRPEEIVRLLDSSNPELDAVRREYEVSEQALRTEVRRQFPDLTIGPGLGTDQGDKRALLGLSLPLPLWNRNRQAIAHASAQREVARGRFEMIDQQLSARLAIALTRYESGRAQREQIESTVVPMADEQDADVRRIASLGRVDPFVMLESLKTQSAAKVRLLEARANESIGAVRLDELIGPPISKLAQTTAPVFPTTTPDHSATER